MSAEDMEAGALAKLEGVGDGTVSRWRKGELPNELRLPRLAAHLSVREEWLKTGQEPMRPLPSQNGTTHTADGHSGARAGDSATAAVAGPSIERMLQALSLRIELALVETSLGAPVSRQDLQVWLELVRRVLTAPAPGSATPEADALADLVEEVDSAEAVNHQQRQADG